MNWSAFDNPQTLVLGGLMFVTAFVLWRNSVLVRRQRNSDQTDITAAPASTMGRAASQLTETASTLQVELHDFLREVEGRIAYKTATLDQLLQETDAELQRLEELLESQRQTMRDNSPAASESVDAVDTEAEVFHLTIQQRRMIGWLAKAGFNAEDIAHFVHLEQRDVERCLRELTGDDQGRRAA